LTLAIDKSIHSFNCNLNIADIDANHRKGRIGKNGNQEGTREEGSRQKGTREEGRKEGRKEEVIAVNHQQGNTQRGALKSVPLSVYAVSALRMMG